MAINELLTRIRLTALDDGASKELKKVEVAAIRSKNEMKAFDAQMNAAQAKQKAVGEQIVARLERQQAETDALKNKVVGLRNAFLGIGLSALFGGMAIKNMFQGILRELTNTFLIVQGETSAFGQATSRLAGAWEYMKFSIMDALMQSGLMTMFIDGLISIIDWVAALPDGWKVFFVIASAVLVALGGMGMVLGQALLLLMIPLQILEWMIGTKITAAMVKAFGSKVIANLTKVKTTLMGMGIAPWLLVAGFVAVGFMFKDLYERTGSWGELFKSVIRGAYNLFGILFSAIGAGMQIYVDLIIRRVNQVLGLYNRIAGVLGLRKIDELMTSGLSFSDALSINMEKWTNDMPEFMKAGEGVRFLGEKEATQEGPLDSFGVGTTTNQQIQNKSTDASMNVQNLTVQLSDAYSEVNVLEQIKQQTMKEIGSTASPN